MTNPDRYIVRAARVVTCDLDRSSASDLLGVISDGALLINRNRIEAVGSFADISSKAQGVPVLFDAGDRVLTPGLVDAHTHLAWAGSRHDEYALRMAGGSYEDIAKMGGGIVSSMKAVRSASQEELVEAMRGRLTRMAMLGTTTCEIKSGYGLDLENETKQLCAIGELARDDCYARVVPTWLALHAIPPEGKADRDRWVNEVVSKSLPSIADLGIARYVDAYIDRNAFSIEEARKVFEPAARLGFGIRAHIGQFADIGGGGLAAGLRAASVDHVENISDDQLQLLARAGTRAVLLPVACLTLRQAPPPVARMREAGVKLVVASDANPGTAPTESLPLAMALGVIMYGLSAEEALLGATREAAQSLGLGKECGGLRKEMSADFVVWDLPHERAIVQPWGSSITAWVVCRGKTLFSNSSVSLNISC